MPLKKKPGQIQSGVDKIREGIRNCRAQCEYFDLCGGGNPSNKYFETGDFRATETLHCKIKNQLVVDAILDHIITSDTGAASIPEEMATP